MKIVNYFNEKFVRIHSESSTKQEMLHEIAEILQASDVFHGYSKDDFYAKLLEREEQTSTGFENGIAIPHIYLDDIDTFHIGIVTSRDGIVYDSIDGKISHVFIFIIGPTHERKEYIKILSGIANIFKSNADAIEVLVKQENVHSLLTTIKHYLQQDHPDDDSGREKKVMMTIFIQNESILNDIIETVMLYSEELIAISDANNVGHYLTKMHLFASLWTEQPDDYLKIISTVISGHNIKKLSDKILKYSSRNEIMITVQQLIHTFGKLDY